MSQHGNPSDSAPPITPGPIGSGAGAPDPTLWLVLSTITTLCCCPPGGMVGIVYSAQAMGSVKNGDVSTAHAQLKTARMWVFISLGLALLGMIAFVVLMIFGLLESVAGAIAATVGAGGTP